MSERAGIEHAAIEPAEIDNRVAALPLEEKVKLLTGADSWGLHDSPAVGLRRMVVSDGPAGVRGETWDERDTSVNLPSPTALAASWDEGLIHRLGLLLAAEARRKGVDVLLAPTVNLHRSPLGGRHFECYSEDPLLTARIGTAYVRGVQDGGVGATVKHFVANDSETDRMTADVRVDDRALREVYLAPFEAIVRDGGAWLVMAAYNAVAGTTMTENALLDDVLRGEWGFDGVVVSDWFATRSTEASARAGLDLVMPGPQGPWGDALVTAVREGKVPEAAVDEKVRRLLRLAARVGALDGAEPPAQPPALTDRELAGTLKEAAATGFVLARNAAPRPDQTPMLPLEAGMLRRVAVLGPNAATARTQGGGSATVFPAYTISPLDGLKAALGPDVEVGHAPGVKTRVVLEPLGGEEASHPVSHEPGVRVRYLDADGNTLAEEHRRTARFVWMGASPGDVPPGKLAAIEVTGVLRPAATGEHLLGIAGLGRFDLRVGDSVLIDDEIALPEGADPFEAFIRPPQRTGAVPLEAGQDAEVRLVRAVAPGDPPFVVFSLGYEEPTLSEDEELVRAVTLAEGADVAVVVVGTTSEIESEGFDRSGLALPGRQDELVRRVAAANARTVVVVNSGSPVELPWADEVPAVLLSWFPGQEAGSALADVLLGGTEPGGRLPTTWPVTQDDCPVLSTQPVDGVLSYNESFHCGYRGWARAGRTPRYAFGHGLGYTTWEYAEVSGPGGIAPGEDAVARVRVRNTGPRAGRTVVQAYLRRAQTAVERPALWLAGFAVVEAGAGRTAEAEVRIAGRAFEHWDEAASAWRTEPGSFELLVGGSSADTPLSAVVKVG